MALITGGTAATTSLNGLKWNAQSAIADIAAFCANIKGQANPTHPIWPGALINGVVDFPDRPNSQVLLLPGDYVFYDNYGWPIVVSRESIASGSSWIHS